MVERCSATAGLSLGEYAALVFAGVMDFETGLAIVQERGRAMQAASDACESGMVSVLGLDREKSLGRVRRDVASLRRSPSPDAAPTAQPTDPPAPPPV